MRLLLFLSEIDERIIKKLLLAFFEYSSVGCRQLAQPSAGTKAITL
jgi:hypothetical protein